MQQPLTAILFLLAALARAGQPPPSAAPSGVVGGAPGPSATPGQTPGIHSPTPAPETAVHATPTQAQNTPRQEKAIATIVASALVGAMLAFPFFLIGQAFLKAYDLARHHQESLIRLERLLNEQLDMVHVHLWQVGTLRANVEKGLLLLDLPRGLPFPDDIGLDLLDLNLVNHLFSLRVTARRLNTDVDNLRTLYGQIRDKFFAEIKDKRKEYVVEAAFVVEGFEKAGSALKEYGSEAEDLLARVRLHVRRELRLPMRFVGFLVRQALVDIRPIGEEELKRELEALAAEVQMVRTRGPVTRRGTDAGGTAAAPEASGRRSSREGQP